MKRKSPYSTGKVLKKRRNERLVYLGIGGALLFVVVIGISLLLRLEAITIANVSFSGLGVLTENDVRPVVERELAGAYAFLIPKRSTFFYPEAGIEQKLASAEKRIKTVNIHREGLNGLSVVIEERKPFAQWCRDLLCYFIDENGFIFAESPVYSGGPVYFRYEGFVTAENPIGEQYVDPEEFRTLSLFRTEMHRIGIQSVSLTLKGDEYLLGIPGGGSVIFVRGTELDRVVNAAQTALSSEAFTDKDLHTLEYLDLRFPNKAVYKWR